MSKKETTDTTGAPENELQQGTVQEEPKFKIGKLREHALDVLGVTVSTFDGAFFNVQKEELSIAEAKQILNSWLKGGK